ncbi:hypothetical protein [Shewanella sp. 4_MG-2023]|uniref:hypothetical protein n=1 Tax=Shewanella sp. 4_MG-2023 TaxID=3062652 RepID=UPI0026E29D71|nr:hypothetical protein [Shewanella sp. 4_MG-2023]MDO6677105.1 hypothetical protein [Shewanella sp. 4_MG-2023]
MRYILVILLLTSHFASASDSREINLLSGKWDCPLDIDVDEIKLKGTATDHYNSDSMTYSSDSTITFIYGGNLPIAKIRLLESGSWEYEKSHLTYRTNDLKIEVIFDYEDILTEETLEQMKVDFMEDEAPIITESIDSEIWVTKDPETNKTSECFKV